MIKPLEYSDIYILYKKSPLHLQGKIYEGVIFEQSQYEIEEEAVRTILLEGFNKFRIKYSTEKVYDKKQADKATKEHKILTGKIFLHEKVYQNCLNIAGIFSEKKMLDKFKDGGLPRNKILFTLESTQCLAEIDLYNPENNVILLVKLTKDAGEPFESNIFKYHNYHRECAWACDAVKHITGEYPKCNIVAVERDYPYVPAFYTIPPHALHAGHLENLSKILDFQRYEASTYPPYHGGFSKTVEMPNWLYA